MVFGASFCQEAENKGANLANYLRHHRDGMEAPWGHSPKGGFVQASAQISRLGAHSLDRESWRKQ